MTLFGTLFGTLVMEAMISKVNLGKPLWIWDIIIPSFENSIKLQDEENVCRPIFNLMFKSSSKFIKASISQ